MSEWKKKRFWKETAVEPRDGGFAVTLDGRGIRTPGKTPLIVPAQALATGIAAEWAAQEEAVRPDTMPLTRAANSTLDKVLPQRSAVVEMLADYGGTDLLCYRAEGPESLVREQNQHWEPHLVWATESLNAPLLRIVGLIPHPQPESSLQVLRDATDALDPFVLTAFHDFVTLPGSLILGFALLEGRIDAAEAIRLSELDALWQEQFWGADDEAIANRTRKVTALQEACSFLNLVRE